MNYKETQYKFGENSLCSSMLGNTNYIRHGNLCEIPCLFEPQYNIPNKTYGSCSDSFYITYKRKENYIWFNDNGYINFLNFNNRNGFVEKVMKINV